MTLFQSKDLAHIRTLEPPGRLSLQPLIPPHKSNLSTFEHNVSLMEQQKVSQEPEGLGQGNTTPSSAR